MTENTAFPGKKKIWGIGLYLILMTTGLYLAFSHWAYDDPFITYRYADHIRQGAGFVYNLDERVLSTTTPLFALILAVLGCFSVDLQQLANLIGAFSLAAGVHEKDLTLSQQPGGLTRRHIRHIRKIRLVFAIHAVNPVFFIFFRK